jgi:hypothetical protein
MADRSGSAQLLNVKVDLDPDPVLDFDADPYPANQNDQRHCPNLCVFVFTIAKWTHQLTASKAPKIVASAAAS